MLEAGTVSSSRCPQPLERRRASSQLGLQVLGQGLGGFLAWITFPAPLAACQCPGGWCSQSDSYTVSVQATASWSDTRTPLHLFLSLLLSQLLFHVRSGCAEAVVTSCSSSLTPSSSSTRRGYACAGCCIWLLLYFGDSTDTIGIRLRSASPLFASPFSSAASQLERDYKLDYSK